MASENLNDFCGSEFWNLNVTWYTDNPDLTICFQRTVLTWIPCAFLWLFSIFELFYIKNSINRSIPWGRLNLTKLTFSGALILLSITDLVVAIASYESHDIFPVDYFTPIIKMVTFAMSATLLNLNRQFGLRTSGLQFLFWFLLLICGIPQLRTQIRLQNDRISNEADDYYADYYFTSYVLFYFLSLALWILNCFADKAPQQTKYPKSEKPCPEESASFISRTLFTWFEFLIWKGYRSPLKQNDLWSMNVEDSSSEIVPVFLKYWNKSVAKASGSDVNKTFIAKALYAKAITSDSVNIVQRKKRKQASILPAICKAFGPTFLFGSLLKLLQDLMIFIPPQLLRFIIDFVDHSVDHSHSANNQTTHETVLYDYTPVIERDPLWRGLLFAVLLFIVASVRSLFLMSQHFQRMHLVGLRIRTAIVGAVYIKALTLSNAARKESTVGEIVNLMAVDAHRFMHLMPHINLIWSAPLQTVLAVYFLWDLLGASVLAGLAVMIILIPLNGVISNKCKKLQSRQMKYKDERVKLMNEILSGIKVLKLYAWESSFEKQIFNIREKEIKVLTTAAYLNASTSFIWSCAPFLVALVSFACFVLSDETHVLDAKTAFVSLSLFNILRFPMTMLPMLISNMLQTSVSIKRINKFMNYDELDPLNISHDPSEDAPLVIENGTFSWGDDEPVLKNINMRVNKNNLVAIVGTVGAGKSSIISAYLGEMDKISGRVNTLGTVAYVSQQAWIQNYSLQNNILFGKPMDRKRYDQVIAACALKPDIDMLPGGDQTEIGEKGINLSGGQKQRVSLARAVYNDADIYFLDDPLSAVDSHVGKHIFEQVIGPTGILARKTRLLVTHGITYLPQVDHIYVIKSGEISESGTLQELVNRKGAFAEFLIEHLQKVNEEENLDEIKQQLESTLVTDSDKAFIGELVRSISQSRSERSQSHSEKGSLNRNMSEESMVSNGDGIRKRRFSRGGSQIDSQMPAVVADEHKEKLIEQERSEAGRVKWGVYKHYLKTIGIWLALPTIFFNILFQGFAIGSSIWLSHWSNDKNAAKDTGLRDMYLSVYASFAVGQVLSNFAVSILLAIGFIYSAKTMHEKLLINVLRWKMELFDTTPLGRILNRFSRDIDLIDNVLPQVIKSWTMMFFALFATLLVISISTYMFLIVIIPISCLYYFVQILYVTTSRQLKRLESVSTSPIYSHFSETIQGASTIRAYNAGDKFVTESENKVDMNQVCHYASIIAQRWLSVRLEVVGNLIILFAALFAVLSRDTMDPGTVGLSVSYALQITQVLNMFVRTTSDVETNIVAVERIKEYTETEQEAAWDIPNVVLPKNWPETGQVKFQNFEVRYREGLDLVLRGLTFTVNGGEKVGIVGRTGAGKSSLTLALFRIIESAGGSIIIDGQDISKLGLHALRSKLTIIPQDPVLFSGSLRMNLDPFGLNSDDEVWRALELAHLKAFVKGLVAGLNHEVAEGGENLSIGQRQLICLARALLRKTKVLILDEATAAVDLETDNLIQKTIRSEFKECTVLTIAHRLNTIMDSDKVIVLDKGRISEYATPSELLLNKKSAFYSMTKDAGLVM